MKHKTMIYLLLFSFLFSFLSSCKSDPDITLIPTGLISIASPSVETTKQAVKNIPTDILDLSRDAQQTLRIDNVSINTDENDVVYIIGFVHNSTNSSVNEIEILVNIYDDNDEILESNKTNSLISNLTTGQSSPFSTIIDTNPNDIGGFNCRIEGFQISEIDPVEVNIIKEGLKEGVDKKYYLTGEIYNHHLEPIIIETVAAGLFDKEGNLISTSRESKFIHYLDPGETGPFQVTLSKYKSQDSLVTDFQTYIEAQVSTLKPYFNLDMGNISTLHYEDTGEFQLAGEITNTANQSLTVSLIAGVYDEQDYLMDVSTTILPVPIFSGETLPFHFMNWQVLNGDKRYQESAANYSIQWDPQLTTPNHAEYVDLSIIDNQVFTNLSTIVLAGSVLNDTKETVSDIVIIGIIYDPESGHIQAVDVQKIMDILSINQSTEYYLVIDVNHVTSSFENNVIITAKGKVISEQR